MITEVWESGDNCSKCDSSNKMLAKPFWYGRYITELAHIMELVHCIRSECTQLDIEELSNYIRQMGANGVCS